MALPQPPIKNMTEFVVFVFVTIVGLLLTFTAVITSIVALLNPERDYSTIQNTIFDILTTIIGALIGFIAGKGAGRAEVHDEHVEREETKRKDTKRGDDT